MIVFGCAVTEPETYESCALPGLRRASEPDTVVMAHQSTGSLLRNYNLILEKASELDDLEAVVLVHQDAEITDDDFPQKLRASLAKPDVAVVGCVGAIGVRNIAWWEGAVTWASFTHRYREFGGGEFPGLSWKSNDAVPPFYELGEVDTIDGFVMGLSPWAVREIRFDESLGLIHGYDFDYCCQVRAAGKKVMTQDFNVIHHHDLNLLRNRESWVEAHMRVAEKWNGSLGGIGTAPDGEDWKRRARRAEAELGAEKLDAASARYQAEALARAYSRVVDSKSWKLTAPLRAPRSIVRKLRGRSTAQTPKELDPPRR